MFSEFLSDYNTCSIDFKLNTVRTDFHFLELRISFFLLCIHSISQNIFLSSYKNQTRKCEVNSCLPACNSFSINF